MNTELLFKLYAIHSPSGSEKKMRRFIRKYITENCGDVTMETDAHGNLLCTKGECETYPCLASHIDQVQRSHSKDFTVLSDGTVAMGYSLKSHEQQGLGADDKNGIFICLECLRMFDLLKVAFFVGEEVGCKGSSVVDLKFFKDCRFIIEPDRRGAHDLITSMSCGEVCSEKFIGDIGYKEFGYSIARGTVTDVGELTERFVGISCLNLSCGYYEAHSDEEFTVLPELENCLDFVTHILETCGEVYPFETSYTGYGYNYGYGYGRYGMYSYGKYGSYGTYGGKSYDGAREQTPAAGSATQAGARILSATEPYKGCDDEMEYYDEGYYSEDWQTMENYILFDSQLTFDEIMSLYADDFFASAYFDKGLAEDVLYDIYWEVKDAHWWNDDIYDDDDDIVYPTKKAS